MSETDRLHAIIDALPPRQIHALLTLLGAQTLDDEAFSRRLAGTSEEDVDAETAARILASEEEPGEYLSHAELKRQLGL